MAVGELAPSHSTLGLGSILARQGGVFIHPNTPDLLSQHRIDACQKAPLKGEGSWLAGSLIPTGVTPGLCHTSMSQPDPSVNHNHCCSSRKLLSLSPASCYRLAVSTGCHPKPLLRRSWRHCYLCERYRALAAQLRIQQSAAVYCEYQNACASLE